MNDKSLKTITKLLERNRDDKEYCLEELKSKTTKKGSKTKLSIFEASDLWDSIFGETIKPFSLIDNTTKKKSKTEDEKSHLDKVANLGCIICREFYKMFDIPAEIHHLRENQGIGMRASDFDVIPLCSKHHRLGGYGVAYHAGRKKFIENFDTEIALLNKTNRLVGVMKNHE